MINVTKICPRAKKCGYMTYENTDLNKNAPSVHVVPNIGN
jgi:hypothetical protein